MEDRSKEKAEALTTLEKTFRTRLAAENETLANQMEDQLEKIYHSRMQEILDFVEQHKAEAFLVRRRAMARHGRQELEEDQEFGEQIRRAVQRKAKSTPANNRAAVKINENLI